MKNKLRQTLFSLAVCGIIALLPSSIMSQSNSVQYKDGLFARYVLGFGTSQLKSDGSSEVKSTTLHTALNGGWVILPQIAAHAGFSYNSVSTADDDLRESDGSVVGTYSTNSRYATLNMGISYYTPRFSIPRLYVIPQFYIPQFYVSPGLRLFLGGSYEADISSSGKSPYKANLELEGAGLGFSLAIGKDWSVYPQLRIGVELQYIHDAFKAKANNASTISHDLIGIALSVTYN